MALTPSPTLPLPLPLPLTLTLTLTLAREELALSGAPPPSDAKGGEPAAGGSGWASWLWRYTSPSKTPSQRAAMLVTEGGTEVRVRVRVRLRLRP